jgi:hypothetical protein
MRALRSRPETHLHFFSDLKVFMDNVLDFHHEYLIRGFGSGLHGYVHLGLGTHVILCFLLATLGLPPWLLFIPRIWLLGLHLQLSADVNPEDRQA